MLIRQRLARLAAHMETAVQGSTMVAVPGWLMVAGYALVFFLADFFALFCVSGTHLPNRGSATACLAAVAARALRTSRRIWEHRVRTRDVGSLLVALLRA